MPRPPIPRRVFGRPGATVFKPAGIRAREMEWIRLTLDEFEAIFSSMPDDVGYGGCIRYQLRLVPPRLFPEAHQIQRHYQQPRKENTTGKTKHRPYRAISAAQTGAVQHNTKEPAKQTTRY